jgi:hypothetical protein
MHGFMVGRTGRGGETTLPRVTKWSGRSQKQETAAFVTNDGGYHFVGGNGYEVEVEVAQGRGIARDVVIFMPQA